MWLHTACQTSFIKKHCIFKISSLFGGYLQIFTVKRGGQPHGSDQCGYLHLPYRSVFGSTVVEVWPLCRLGCHSYCEVLWMTKKLINGVKLDNCFLKLFLFFTSYLKCVWAFYDLYWWWLHMNGKYPQKICVLALMSSFCVEDFDVHYKSSLSVSFS